MQPQIWWDLKYDETLNINVTSMVEPQIWWKSTTLKPQIWWRNCKYDGTSTIVTTNMMSPQIWWSHKYDENKNNTRPQIWWSDCKCDETSNIMQSQMWWSTKWMTPQIWWDCKNNEESNMMEKLQIWWEIICSCPQIWWDHKYDETANMMLTTNMMRRQMWCRNHKCDGISNIMQLQIWWNCKYNETWYSKGANVMKSQIWWDHKCDVTSFFGGFKYGHKILCNAHLTTFMTEKNIPHLRIFMTENMIETSCYAKSINIKYTLYNQLNIVIQFLFSHPLALFLCWFSLVVLRVQHHFHPSSLSSPWRVLAWRVLASNNIW